MGISSNQARFLALTSRQVDLEHRIQQICQRRLRLASSLENTATSYNNQISNRQLYGMTTSGGISKLSIIGGTSSALSITNASGTQVPIKDSNGNDYLAVTWNTSGSSYYRVIFSGSAITDSSGTWIDYNTLGLPSTATQSEVLDAALRGGLVSLVSKADEFTQTPTAVAGLTDKYEIKDWRTLPQIADELYNGDDVDAENKYDKTINEINAQDKKLQLEQTSIEVEYKAITSEKESVKKVLDTNAQSSFKYFS